MTDLSSLRIAGVPIFGGGGMLPIMGGNIAATGEQKNYFVDPANASGDGGTGLVPSSAKNTVSAAEDVCRDKSGDTVYLLNDGNTSGTSREDATITWDKDNVHLVGLCAPTLNQRSRISPSAETTRVSPQLTVSGNGNIFHNISFVEANTTAADSTCISVTGLRNYFSNISMLNMLGSGGDDAATRAGSNVLLLTAAEECTFYQCNIGADTTTRSAANASIKCASAATRIKFIECTMNMLTDDATAIFLDANTSGAIDRYILFRDCDFINAAGSGATELTEAFSVHATVGGMVIIAGQTNVFGAKEWESGDTGNVFTALPTNTITGLTAGGVGDALAS